MKALVLAAGYGTRLRPLTDHVPKPLVPVLNRPVLAHVLERLRAAGIREVAINTHWHGDLLRDHVGAGDRYGVRVTWFPEPELLGSAGTVRACREFFGADPVLVTCADIISTFDIEGLVRQHGDRRPAVTVAAAPVRASWGGDRVTLDGAFRVAGYRYKPDDCDWGLGCFGMWVMEPWLADEMPAAAQDFTREVLPTLADDGAVEAFDGGPTRLTDVGEFELLHNANVRALEGVFSLCHGYRQVGPGVHAADVDPTARGVTCHGAVAIGAFAKIEPGVHLVGPTVVGTGASIGSGSTVRRSVLLPGAVVPSGSLLSDGIFGEPTRVLAWLRE